MQLKERDRRAMKILGACAAGLFIAFLAGEWLGHWSSIRKRLAEARVQMEVIDPCSPKHAALSAIVPVFEMPVKVEEQGFLFRDKLDEQLKKAGLMSKPLKVTAQSKSRSLPGYQVVCVECGGRCSLEQAMDLLAALNENPFLVGIEELRITGGQDPRQQIELNMVVSTFGR